MVITSFFTQNSIPAIGLSPILDIWEVNGTTETKVIDGDSMSEVGDGFYQYNFVGYDRTKIYVIRSDGGNVLSADERYNIGSSDQSILDPATIGDVVSGVWDETTISHLVSGSFGLTVQQIKADTSQLRLDIVGMVDLVTLMLKYERNRTKIDKVAKTLTVYDDDNLTPIRVFTLYDSTGVPNTAEIAEKVPH